VRAFHPSSALILYHAFVPDKTNGECNGPGNRPVEVHAFEDRGTHSRPDVIEPAWLAFQVDRLHKVKVEAIVAAAAGGFAIDIEVAVWLSKIGVDLHAKLVAVGLAVPRCRSRLGDWLTAYIDSRTDVRPNTARNLRMARQRLIDHFGVDRDLRDISSGDADDWALSLKESLAIERDSRGNEGVHSAPQITNG
jgi:hypothetical protein